MDSGFVREDLRIAFPADYLMALAIWVRPKQIPLRTTLASLQKPEFRMQFGGGDALSILDVSCKGMMLRITAPHKDIAIDPGQTGLYMYAQLRDPWGRSPLQRLSLFFYCRVAMQRRDEEGLLLGVEFLRQGLGAKLEKTLEFINVEKYGVDDLQRWCQELLRQRLPQAEPTHQGLDLDCLLEELDAQSASSAS